MLLSSSMTSSSLCGPAAAVSPGNLLEMQIGELYPRNSRAGYGDLRMCVLLIDLISESKWGLTAQLSRKNRESPYPSCPTHAQPPPRSAAPGGGTFVTTDEPTWTIIVTQSLRLTSGLTLDAVRSVGLDTRMVRRIYHYSITHNSFVARKMFCALTIRTS